MLDRMITPSILNVEKNKRIEVINKLIDLGIKWIHYDIMDNKFVPNSAIEIEEIISFQKECPKHLSDVHLMVENPKEYADKLKDYTTCLTIHFEAFNNDKEIIDFVNEYCHTNWVGLAIKPNTKFEQFAHLIYLFDIVLIMSVEPGFGGQKFIDETIKKIDQVKEFIDEEKLHTIIQVDGGINDSNSKKIFEHGSSFNVVGSYLMNNLNSETLKKLGKK